MTALPASLTTEPQKKGNNMRPTLTEIISKHKPGSTVQIDSSQIERGVTSELLSRSRVQANQVYNSHTCTLPVFSERDSQWVVTLAGVRFYGDTSESALGAALLSLASETGMILHFHNPEKLPRGDGLDPWLGPSKSY